MDSASDGWGLVEEEEPDEIDLQMIREMESDPDCAVLAEDEEVRRMMG